MKHGCLLCLLHKSHSFFSFLFLSSLFFFVTVVVLEGSTFITSFSLFILLILLPPDPALPSRVLHLLSPLLLSLNVFFLPLFAFPPSYR